MASDGFRSIRLKKSLLDAVEKFMIQHPELGYKGIADFVDEATRDKLLELQAHYSAMNQQPPAVQEVEG